MNMWQVYEKKTFSRTLKKIPQEVIKNYEVWKRIVELEGPKGLKLIKVFRDETLKGKWRGYRSSRLNKQWRVIYKHEKTLFEIFVIELTPHKY